MNDAALIRRVIGTRRTNSGANLTWFGQRVDSLAASTAADALSRVIYRWAYICGGPIPMEDSYPAAEDERWNALEIDSRLSACWSGWLVTSASTVTQPGQPLIRVDRGADAVGSQVSLPLPPQSRRSLPGWALVRHGDARTTRSDHRVYLNTKAAPLIGLMPALTAVLVDRYAGFSAKFLTNRDHGWRSDSTVLYLPGEPDPALLDRVLAVVEPALASATVPMFTHRYAGGVALAPTPPDGRSFGQQTSRCLAEDIVGALRDETRTDTFTPAAYPGVTARSTAGPHLRRTSDQAPVEELEQCISWLAASALRTGNRVSWLVRQTDGSTRSMGADVYTGFAGPLLLCAIAAATEVSRSAKPLLRAIARSMLERQRDLAGAGFHAGQPGSAAVLAEAARISDDDEVSALAQRSLDLASASWLISFSWDVIDGSAGTILGLSSAARLLNRGTPHCLEALRSSLLKSARRDPATGALRWMMGGGRRSRAVAGLAHGGSGAALALAAVNDPAAALKATLFEDSRRLDEDGWLDRRMHPLNVHLHAWCHGSAGIGIATSGMRAMGMSHSRLAGRVERSARFTLAALDRDEADEGICHGASGRALALHVMDAVPHEMIAHTLSSTQPAFAVDDYSLMTGRIGRTVARLVLDGLAPTPLAVTLMHADAALVRRPPCSKTDG